VADDAFAPKNAGPQHGFTTLMTGRHPKPFTKRPFVLRDIRERMHRSATKLPREVFLPALVAWPALVARQVLGADAVEGAVKPALHVAEQDMDDGQHGIGVFAALLDDRIVAEAVGQTVVTLQAIGDDAGAGLGGAADKAVQMRRGGGWQGMGTAVKVEPRRSSICSAPPPYAPPSANIQRSVEVRFRSRCKPTCARGNTGLPAGTQCGRGHRANVLRKRGSPSIVPSSLHAALRACFSNCSNRREGPFLKRPWWGPVVRGCRAMVAFVAHATIAALLIGLMYAVEYVLAITKQEQRMLLDVLPMRFLFDLIDTGLILLFGTWGLIDMNKELRTPVFEDDETAPVQAPLPQTPPSH
jgi:hypothetical protein